jgi:hypothetical protein
MTTLTPEIARSLMHRAMTTGVSTPEMDKYGGYNTVAKMYERGGGQYDRAEIDAKTLTDLARQVANQGSGNLAILKDTNTPLTAAGIGALRKQGITDENLAILQKALGPNILPTGGAPANDATSWEKRFGELQSQYGTLEQQLAAMQKQYEQLVSQYGRQGGLGTGGIVGGSLVDDGSTLNPGQMGAGGMGLGNTGKVYGPDGKEYSSPAAAIAAGVANFTYARPLFSSGLINAATLNSNPFLQSSAGGNNVSSGAATFNQNPQLFSLGAPQLGARSANKDNPFAG